MYCIYMYLYGASKLFLNIKSLHRPSSQRMPKRPNSLWECIPNGFGDSESVVEGRVDFLEKTPINFRKI